MCAWNKLSQHIYSFLSLLPGTSQYWCHIRNRCRHPKYDSNSFWYHKPNKIGLCEHALSKNLLIFMLVLVLSKKSEIQILKWKFCLKYTPLSFESTKTNKANKRFLDSANTCPFYGEMSMGMVFSCAHDFSDHVI